MIVNRKLYLAFLITFLVKVVLGYYFTYLARCQGKGYTGVGYFSIRFEDTISYVEPWKNLLAHGSYSLDGVGPYAGRMPFPGLIFFLFYLFFYEEVAYELAALSQLIVASISAVLMALLSEKLYAGITGNAARKEGYVFWLYLLLALGFMNLTFMDAAILSESLSISFLCLFSYYYYNYQTQARSYRYILLIGLHLGLSVLWRPYLIVLYVPVILEMVYYHRWIHRDSIFRLFRSIILFCLPIGLIDLPWVIRNAVTFGRFIPFQSDIYAGFYSDGYVAYLKFAQLIGGSPAYWDTRSFACYFEHLDTIPCSYKHPSYLIGSHLTHSKLEKGRFLLAAHKRNPQDRLLEQITIHYFGELSEDYKRDHPYTYWLISAFPIMEAFFVHSGVTYFPMMKGYPCYHFTHYYLVKGSQAIFYWLLVTMGWVGLVYVFMRDSRAYIPLLVPILLTILFPGIYRADEPRYFWHAFPFLVLGLTVCMQKISDYIRRKRKGSS
jgi:hypothetical protein